VKCNLLATDGASNKLGWNKGVTALFPDVLVWHCCNHRLELTVKDVIREINEIDHMKLFLINCTLCILFHPKTSINKECVFLCWIWD
jgi:hypothetical protein